MITDPQTFFRFAEQNHALLTDLYYHNEGLSDGDIQDLIARNAQPGGPEAGHVMDRLVTLRIIEQIPGETARWEMTHPVKTLLRFLLHEQRLTSVAVIQAYLDDLGSTRIALEACIARGDRAAAVIGLLEMSETIDRLRQDSADNRTAILATVMNTKANEGHLSAFERFGIVNRIWERYMDPMRDLVDVRKSMEDLLDGLDRLLYSGVLRFSSHPDTSAEFAGCRARLLRMRRSVASDFHESLREIEPLYQSLEKESELARGASVALSAIERQGVDSLDLDRLLGIPAWRTEGLMSDSELTARLFDLVGYSPGEALVVTRNEPSRPGAFADPEEVLSSLRSSVPVEDALSWLSDRYSSLPLLQILRLYGAVYASIPGERAGTGERREYSISGSTVTAVPLAVRELELA